MTLLALVIVFALDSNGESPIRKTRVVAKRKWQNMTLGKWPVSHLPDWKRDKISATVGAMPYQLGRVHSARHNENYVRSPQELAPHPHPYE